MVESRLSTTPAGPPASPQRSPFLDANFFPWEHFVARNGEQGAGWYALYVESGCQALKERTEQAVALLRSRRLEAGRELLAECRLEIDRLDGDRPELRAVVNRWYHTAIAYHHYLTADFAAAAVAVDQACAALEAAVQQDPLLLPFAHHRIGIQVLHVIIAREQRRWDDMRWQLELIQQLAEDRQPLCRAAGGTPVFFATIDRYIRALPRLTAEERLFAEQIFGRESRLQRMGPLVRQAYALPGLVISYP